MQFFKQQTHFDFMSKRKLALVFSSLLIIISITSLFTRGLNFGLDFTGGTLIEVGYPEAVDLKIIRGVVHEAGLGDAIVQHFGTAKDVLVRIAPREDQNATTIGDKVFQTLNAVSKDEIKMRRQEYVGPQVGDELTEDGGLAMLYALIGILIYVTLRFEKRFSVGAVMALIHDVIITMGFFSLLQIEFDLSVLAAVLAVIGYSLNDTIVVFDRIRENFRKMRKVDAVGVMNASVNQTLSRTVNTSFTTLLVLGALFAFGGEIIHAFAFTLIVGVLVGTYSSIYVASTTLLELGVSKFDLLVVEKEGAAIGVGPIDATYRAIDDLTETSSKLLFFSVSSFTGGTDALGDVLIRIEDNGKVVIGNGLDPDIITAAGKAYLNGLNRLVYLQKEKEMK